jgi:hypothetical protein
MLSRLLVLSFDPLVPVVTRLPVIWILAFAGVVSVCTDDGVIPTTPRRVNMPRKEMLAILACLPATIDALDAMKREALALDAVCNACDGSVESVDAVEEVANALQSAGAECATLTWDVGECARRVCNRLY